MKLALGTVQFGLDYGVTNSSGQVSKKEVVDILDHAGLMKMHMLDTAAAYGTSESIIGSLSTQQFDIVSKVPALTNLNKSVSKCISESLIRLNREFIYGLMFHNENDLLSSKKPFNELVDARYNGLVKKIGCSFYTVDALKQALEMKYELDLIQIPFNCLDQRFLQSGLIKEAKSRGIEIHSRSLFLQGLLLDKSVSLPIKLIPFQEELIVFFKFCETHDLSPLMATLKLLQQTVEIDYGVVGCISKLQLSEITTAYQNVQNDDEYIDFKKLSSTNNILLNPTQWN